MIKNAGGSIINVSLGATLRGDMARTAYAASKVAIATLSYYIASQFGRDGIRCNVIRPIAIP
jgi:NAD(P)-dependent dehydrogenase (short-subunit alcohol dehydrogenase family)